MPLLKVLEYLKKQGPTNTFKLARNLHIDRHKILNIIKKLQKEEAVEIKRGIVKFLKFPKLKKKIKIYKVKIPVKKKKRKQYLNQKEKKGKKNQKF